MRKRILLRYYRKGYRLKKKILEMCQAFLNKEKQLLLNDSVLIENGKTIFEENALVGTFNDLYVYIVEKSTIIV